MKETTPLTKSNPPKKVFFDKHPHIWRAREQPPQENKFSFGIRALDEALHGGVGASGVVRVASLTGIGEITLFKHILATPRAHKLRVFIKPPARLQAPWLTNLGIDSEQVLIVHPKTDKDALWAAEQCLKSAACHCVLLWNNTLQIKEARRLQVAATHNDALCLLFTSSSYHTTPFPITLDLCLQIREAQLIIDITKQRHGWPASNIVVPHSWTPNNNAIQWAMQNNKSPTQELHSVI